jgi:beta-glucosidase
VSEHIESLLKELTLDEKVSLVSGVDMWHTPAVSRLGIPGLKVTDGPSGARGGSFGGEQTSVNFPCGSALAATWNPDLIEQVGSALAEECHTKGSQVLLGPTINLHRHPLNGRHFECYSEDPLLTAEIAVAWIRGLQAGGVGGCAKHFVCNDSEFQRHTISSEVPERALRELYLRPFEAAVKRADVWSVMSAYNKINGTYASAHRELLTDVLKGEWGFEGFVVSDWFGTQGCAESAHGGLDLEMPGPARVWGADLLAAIESGDASEPELDDKVRRILDIAERTGAFETAGEPEAPERAEDKPEHRTLVRRTAAEGMVLLQNEGGVLPLRASGPGAVRKIAVIGPNARNTGVQGGGSARVSPHYQVNALDGITERAGSDIEVHFAPGCTSHKTLPVLGGSALSCESGDGLRLEFWNSLDLSGDVVHEKRARQLQFNWFGPFNDAVNAREFSARLTGIFTPPESGLYTFGLTSAGKSRLSVGGQKLIDNWTSQERGSSFFGAGSTEVPGEIQLEAGNPVELRIDYSKEGAPLLGGLQVGCLHPVPDNAMEQAEALAAECDAAILVVGLNADWESEGHDREHLELPGRQVELIERVAAANPRTVVVLNTGAPIELPWLGRVPAALQMWYAGQETGNALADVLFGDVNPSGRLPTTWPHRLEDTPAFVHYPGELGEVHYGEGLFIGYRHYDARQIEPLFAFGHGLSYTTFEYTSASATVREGPGEDDGGDLEVTIDVAVRNTGLVAGQEVIQLYVRDLEASVLRPERELAAFAKVSLEPGKTQTVRLSLGAEALSFWDKTRRCWVAEAGEYEVHLGGSSRDLRATAPFTLEREHLASAARDLRS